MHFRPPLLTLVLASLVLASCGGSDPKALTDEGAAALHSGDAKAALSSFDRALEKMKAGDPEFLRASVGRCQALARIEPERAKHDFLELARAEPPRVRETDFTAVALDLLQHGSLGPAIEIAEAGMKLFPDSPAMKSLRDRIGDAAKQASDPEALKRLKGLGYAGDG